MKNSKVIVLLVLILAAASFLRLYSLDSAPPGLHSDEAMNGNNAIQALADGDFKSFYTENNGREGLFINLQAFFIELAGSDSNANPIGPLRLPSAMFGILTVLGTFFLTREMFRNYEAADKIALLASFLIATSFWHINFSRIAFRAIMAPAFLTWGLYFLLLSFRKFKEGQWSNVNCQLLLPALAGLIYGLGMHSYIAYRATPLLIVFLLWLLGIRHGWKGTLKIGAIFVAVSIIVFLPLGFYFWENPADFFGRTSQISIWQSQTPFKNLGLNVLKTAGMFNFAGDWNPRHNIPGQPLLYWPVGILFIIGFFAGIKSLFKSKKPEKQAFWIIFAWLVIAALPVIVSNEGLPHALRAILMAPPVFMLAAVGGFRLYEFTVKKLRAPELLLKTAVFVLLILLFFQVGGNYFINWAKNPAVAAAFNNDFVEVGNEINKLPPEMPKYVVIDTGGFNIREIGTPAQTIMYITNTFLPEKQEAKNIHYILPSEVSEIPENSLVFKL